MPMSDVPLDPAEVDFIHDLLAECFGSATARQVAFFNVRTFARWLAVHRPGTTLAAVTPADCRAFLDERAGQVAPSTLAKNWSDLRAFYAAAESDVTDPLDGRRSPMARIKMPHQPRYAIKHAATVAEVDAIIATFDRTSMLGLRNAAMVSLMFRSGLRVSEVARLWLSDLDLDERRVTLAVTKSGYPRQPTLHPETITLLRRYLRRRGERPGALFVKDTHDTPLPADAIKTIVKRAATRTGQPQVTPHALRRGFVVEYLTHGGDVATLMVLGGWQSEVMIVRYMGDQRNRTARSVFDQVAARQVASRRRR